MNSLRTFLICALIVMIAIGYLEAAPKKGNKSGRKASGRIGMASGDRGVGSGFGKAAEGAGSGFGKAASGAGAGAGMAKGASKRS